MRIHRKYNDEYVFESKLTNMQQALIGLSLNEVFGPYKDGTSYKLSNNGSKKMIADSTKVRHILIPFIGSVLVLMLQ